MPSLQGPGMREVTAQAIPETTHGVQVSGNLGISRTPPPTPCAGNKSRPPLFVLELQNPLCLKGLIPDNNAHPFLEFNVLALRVVREV